MPWFSFHFNDFALSFLSILLEGIPFILLGSIISGIVDVFVSSERMARLLPRNGTAAILLSGLLGLIFPMCECGSVIVIRRFIKKGLPISAAVTYMLAAPIVSPIVAFSTFAAFKGQNPWVMTSLRLSIGYLIAVAIGGIVRRISNAELLQPGILSDDRERSRTGLHTAAMPSDQDFSAVIESSNFRQKILLTIQSATADFLDVAFFLIIGAAIASIFNTAVDQSIILPFATNLPLAIVTLMALAAGLALCSTTDAFVAASFATFPPEAKLAFLLFGPMFDLKLFWLYGMIFRRRAVITLAIALFVVIALICWRIGAIHIWG
ncbi:MAG: permease [Chthoniobacteraceae bacterium]